MTCAHASLLCIRHTKGQMRQSSQGFVALHLKSCTSIRTRTKAAVCRSFACYQRAVLWHRSMNIINASILNVVTTRLLIALHDTAMHNKAQTRNEDSIEVGALGSVMHCLHADTGSSSSCIEMHQLHFCALSLRTCLDMYVAIILCKPFGIGLQMHALMGCGNCPNLPLLELLH